MHQALDPVEARPLDAAINVESMRVTVTMTEAQAVAVAGGYVPNAVRAMIRELLDWSLDHERRAERPIKETTTRRRRTASKRGSTDAQASTT